MKKIQTAILSSLLFTSTPLMADSLDTDAIVGGALGGAVGAAVGSELGGRNGAIIGSAIGGATGTAITTRDRQERTVIQREVIYVDRNDRHEAIHGGPPPWAPAHGYRHKHRHKHHYHD